MPSGDGFILSDEDAANILARGDAEYAQVVRPYLIGDDITSNPDLAPTRWIIDFKAMALEQAMAYPAALEIVRRRVKPHRDVHKKRREREEWWKFSRTVPALFSAIESLSRILPVRTHPSVSRWCGASHIGLRAMRQARSRFRTATAWAFSRQLSIRVGQRRNRPPSETRPRYTTASFSTFPWPRSSDTARSRIAELSRAVTTRRREICLEREIGLTRLYNEVEDGAYRDLRDLHRQLDEAVSAAYGWPPSAAHDPSNRTGGCSS